MKFFIFGVLSIFCFSLIFADDHSEHRGAADAELKKNEKTNDEPKPAPKEPVIGNWNLTNEHDELCVKMVAGITLNIVYKTLKNENKTATIMSDEFVKVDKDESKCRNASTDVDETMSLQFADDPDDRILKFTFTREQNGNKWQLYNVSFHFKYDEKTFPDALHKGMEETLSSQIPVKGISSLRANSFGCTKPPLVPISGGSDLTFNNLRVQPFITGNDFGQAEWCSQDQTSDLIPIIIGAALAALVIIVLIAYLVGRARARTTTYDNI